MIQKYPWISKLQHCFCHGVSFYLVKVAKTSLFALAQFWNLWIFWAKTSVYVLVYVVWLLKGCSNSPTFLQVKTSTSKTLLKMPIFVWKPPKSPRLLHGTVSISSNGQFCGYIKLFCAAQIISKNMKKLPKFKVVPRWILGIGG